VDRIEEEIVVVAVIKCVAERCTVGLHAEAVALAEDTIGGAVP
jgi:hypothetical protein